MAVGFRTIAAQSGEIPARLPNQPRTIVAVKTAMAVRGSVTHRHPRRIVSIQLSRVTRGVFATIREGSHAGASYTGKLLVHTSRFLMPASNSSHAEHDLMCISIRSRSEALSVS